LRCGDSSFTCCVLLIATLTIIRDAELSLSSFGVGKRFLLQQHRLTPKCAAEFARFAVSIGDSCGMFLLKLDKGFVPLNLCMCESMDQSRC
jgi:hypothetical protein